ncbi:MAG: fasciclin domain-containing protein, partial [Prolixibacteraceae bacterium]|nr:fasciclin domain-containing protein [Prolixibacteraceae bacterium]
MHNIKLKSIIGKSLIIFALLYVFNACKPEIVEPEISTDEYVISDYIEIGEDSIKYTEFNQLLLNTQLNGLLAIRGPFTLFLPNNEAMDAYYASKGISSASDLDIETQKELVYNHLIVSEIYSGDIGLGAIRELNALGDKLATEFVGENYQDILINKTAIIIDRDIIVSNGIIHEIDKVIEPITINVFDVVSSDPSFSLFTQALELTGISDTLKIIDFQYDPNVDKLARNYFTLLAVPNTVFNRYGINTIDEMVNYFTNAPDSVSYVYNQFYQFIEYHCLNGSHYLSDLEDDKLYPVLSFNNNVLVNIENDYMVNYIDST